MRSLEQKHVYLVDNLYNICRSERNSSNLQVKQLVLYIERMIEDIES